MAFCCWGRTLRNWIAPFTTNYHLKISRVFSVKLFQYLRYQILSITETKRVCLSKFCSTINEDYVDNIGVHPHKRTIFVSKLSAKTTENSLRKYFSKYGDVEDVSLIRNPNTGQSKCFAFVQFKDVFSAQKLLYDKHFLDERSIQTEKNLVSDLRAHKVFVRNLSSELTEDILRNHFSQFGEVRSVDFVVDNVTNERKDFCFVEFVSLEAANKALSMPVQDIQQTQVQVRKNIARLKRFIPGKILAGGLDDNVTVKDLKVYFEKYGNVIAVEMNFVREGKMSRTLGFVTFENTTVPDLVTRSSIIHKLNGRKFRVTKATSDATIEDRDLKVFIENVPADKSLDEVQDYLEAFGPIEQVHCIKRLEPTDDTQCFVIKFATESAADTAALDRSIWIDDHNLIIRKLGWTSATKKLM